ncbi:hypothetical protein U1Q18_052156, partial [Sarracenia purpurea var. burkii]
RLPTPTAAAFVVFSFVAAIAGWGDGYAAAAAVAAAVPENHSAIGRRYRIGAIFDTRFNAASHRILRRRRASVYTRC